MARTDAFSDFDDLLSWRPADDPWSHAPGGQPVHRPDYALLGELLAVPLAAGDVSESGRFARAIDAWVAQEFRRMGFGADEVWPRPARPRVLPRDVAVLLERLPRALASEVRRRLPDIAAVGPVDARVLGRAYEKQVDVCVARWDRGPELMVSTKAQLSSFAKNLPNRFEEAYGDAGNLRGRYPLAAVGFLFLQRATILEREPDAFERAVDMVRKLRDHGDGNGYTATALVLADWTSGDPAPPRVREDAVPADVAAPQFFTRMVARVLEVTPVVHHVTVRSRFERRAVPVAEDDAAG